MSLFGASFANDTVTFRVWAPRCRAVEVVLPGRVPRPLVPGEDGVFEGAVAGVGAGDRYRYRLDGERDRPDPVSRSQPEGVHGWSEVVDPAAFPWTDQGYRGRALADLVIYELHVGTFSPEGTFQGVIPHLDRLADLGVTTVELMPVAEFPGGRNWGYDGVHLFAPQSTYGGPTGLRRLVDACHARGLGVLLDVVYNHLGPEGNYLDEYGPYFTDRHRTPWGPAIDFEGPASAHVRRHFVDNARHWVREYHLDGLRLDAIHAIHDSGPVHLLTEIAGAAHEEGRRRGHPVHVVAESHDNDRHLVLPASAGGIGLDGLWSDDLHHALHARLTGERTGYYGDFDDPRYLPRALAEGFAYQGQQSRYFGRRRGTPSGDLPADRFVVFAQNHDQVGNRACGDRLASAVGPAAARLAAAVVLAAPAIPLLFMGEEYAEPAPFLFFTSYLDGRLAEAVRAGRLREFVRFAWSGPVADPGEVETFLRSRLDQTLASRQGHREMLHWYRRWLALRRAHPALGARHKDRAHAALDAPGRQLTLTRSAPSGERVLLVANLAAEPMPWTPPAGSTVLLDSDDPEFGGRGTLAPLGPWQVLLLDLPR